MKKINYPNNIEYTSWYQQYIRQMSKEIKQFSYISKCSSCDYNRISNCPESYPIDSVITTLEEITKNKKSIEILKERLSEKTLNKNGLFIYGSNGIGKTVIAKELIKKHNNNYRCFFTESYKLLQCIKSAWSNENYETFLNYLQDADLFVLDDILKFDKERDSELVEEFFCDRMEYKPTIFTTNLDPEIFAKKYPSFWSRINQFCDIIKLIGDDFRLKKGDYNE